MLIFDQTYCTVLDKYRGIEYDYKIEITGRRISLNCQVSQEEDPLA